MAVGAWHRAGQAAAEPACSSSRKTAAFRHGSIPAGVAGDPRARRGQRLRRRLRPRTRRRSRDDEPGSVRRGRVALDHRRRARRGPAGGVRGLHPGRRRLRRRARGQPTRSTLELVRRPGRRVLQQPPEIQSARRSRSPTTCTRRPSTCRRAGRASTSGTTSNPTRAARSTCSRPRTRRRTPGGARWAPTIRSPGVSYYQGGAPGTRAWATPTRPTPTRSSASTCSAASCGPPACSRQRLRRHGLTTTSRRSSSTTTSRARWGWTSRPTAA